MQFALRRGIFSRLVACFFLLCSCFFLLCSCFLLANLFRVCSGRAGKRYAVVCSRCMALACRKKRVKKRKLVVNIFFLLLPLVFLSLVFQKLPAVFPQKKNLATPYRPPPRIELETIHATAEGLLNFGKNYAHLLLI